MFFINIISQSKTLFVKVRFYLLSFAFINVALILSHIKITFAKSARIIASRCRSRLVCDLTKSGAFTKSLAVNFICGLPFLSRGSCDKRLGGFVCK